MLIEIYFYFQFIFTKIGQKLFECLQKELNPIPLRNVQFQKKTCFKRYIYNHFAVYFLQCQTNGDNKPSYYHRWFDIIKNTQQNEILSLSIGRNIGFEELEKISKDFILNNSFIP